MSKPARPSIICTRAVFSSSSQRQTLHGGSEHGAHRLLRPEERVLRDVGHFGLLSQRPLAGIGRLPAGQDLQQRGFAAAIRPDQTDPVSIGNAQRKVLQTGFARHTTCADRRHSTKRPSFPSMASRRSAGQILC